MASTSDQIERFFDARGTFHRFMWIDILGRETADKASAVMLSVQKRLDVGGIISVRLGVDQLEDYREQLASLDGVFS